MSKQTRKRRHEPAAADPDMETTSPKAKLKPSDAEEHLTKILFGGTSSFLKSLEEAEHEATRSNIDSGVGEDDSEGSDTKDPAPAWFDDDDDGIEVGQALDIQARKLPQGGANARSGKYHSLLKHKFTATFGTPKWAALAPKPADSDSDDDVLQACGFLRKPARGTLAPGALELKKVRDLNAETYSEGAHVNAVEFHRASSVALVAGHSGVASLYAVDGRRNSKLHSVALQHFPVFCARFLRNEALLGSRHAHLFSYDLLAAKPLRVPLPSGVTQAKRFAVSPDEALVAVAGKWGEVHVLAAASKERVATLKQEAEVGALAFGEGGLLFGHGDGEVSVWDVGSRRVRHRFVDEGCLRGSALAASGQFLAAGSAQGVVNVYGMEEALAGRSPKPRRTVLNLTTGITDLKFNASEEVLAIASADVKNGVKMVHVGSGTVFSNFPTFGSRMGNVNVVGFSPGSGFVAFGNRKSTVALYRLKHYKNY